jgi:mannosyltransferase OCH1-like enzyme
MVDFFGRSALLASFATQRAPETTTRSCDTGAGIGMPSSSATQTLRNDSAAQQLRRLHVPPPRVRTTTHACTPLGAAPSVHTTLEDNDTTPLVVRQTWKERKLPFWVASHRRRLMALNPSYRFEIWDDRDCEH